MARLSLATTTLASLAVLGCGGRAAPPAPPGSEAQAAKGGVCDRVYTAGGRWLAVQIVRDDVVHFELGDGAPPPPGYVIPSSPMIAARPPAPLAKRCDAAELRVEVDPQTLCVTVFDEARGFELHRACPSRAGDRPSLSISRSGATNAWGLGEAFVEPGTMDGDWMGRVRHPGNAFGNAMPHFDFLPGEKDTGSVGNAQFPVLYAAGRGKNAYALFVDSPYAQTWSFEGDPWKMHAIGGPLRWYVFAGPDLADVRRDYMDFVGHALVPPRKAFGLWISEYGYDDWKELDDKLATLRRARFPVDGFVLDLQWFGGVTQGSDTSRMGTLDWDGARFPDAARKIRALYEEQGIGLVTIEESYVSRGLAEHADLERRGFLAKDCPTCGATYLVQNPWWGKGGMIDWSNPAAGDYWHDTKRQKLVDAGIVGHWCDLGEPEMFDEKSVYFGGREADVHDLFTFFWVEGIARGYARHGVLRRPFMMARSGAPGMQRFGAVMWSGDIGSNLTSLASHQRAAMHVAMSGIDYFGADIGGFIRAALRSDLDELYTVWLADGMAVDVPGRVHTDNHTNERETAPDRVGDRASNLANVRRRYELVPYVYSLAHRAWRTGDAVFPPLFVVFPEDPNVRTMGGEKMIGESVLVAMAAGPPGATTRDVYLPRATWFDWTTGARIESRGEWRRAVPLRENGLFQLPTYARGGSIIPLMHVDDQTMNVFGRRLDGTRRDELVVRVFPDVARPAENTLFEDDGETIAYQKGEVRATALHARASASSVDVTIDGAKGSYAGAPASRSIVLRVASPGRRPARLRVDGKERGLGGFAYDGSEVVIDLGSAPVTQPRIAEIAY